MSGELHVSGVCVMKGVGAVVGVHQEDVSVIAIDCAVSQTHSGGGGGGGKIREIF